MSKLLCTGAPACGQTDCDCFVPHHGLCLAGCVTLAECRHAGGKRVQCREARPDPEVVGKRKRSATR